MQPRRGYARVGSLCTHRARVGVLRPAIEQREWRRWRASPLKVRRDGLFDAREARPNHGLDVDEPQLRAPDAEDHPQKHQLCVDQPALHLGPSWRPVVVVVLIILILILAIFVQLLDRRSLFPGRVCLKALRLRDLVLCERLLVRLDALGSRRHVVPLRLSSRGRHRLLPNRGVKITPIHRILRSCKFYRERTVRERFANGAVRERRALRHIYHERTANERRTSRTVRTSGFAVPKQSYDCHLGGS